MKPVRARRRGQTFGDPQPIRGAPPRTDQRDGELVAGLEAATRVEQCRWIGRLEQGLRITWVAAWYQVDAKAVAELDLGSSIQVAPGALDLLGNLRPHSGNVAQLGQRGLEHAAGGPEPLEQCPADVRAHAGHHGQEHQVADVEMRGALVQTDLQFVVKQDRRGRATAVVVAGSLAKRN